MFELDLVGLLVLDPLKLGFGFDLAGFASGKDSDPELVNLVLPLLLGLLNMGLLSFLPCTAVLTLFSFLWTWLDLPSCFLDIVLKNAGIFLLRLMNADCLNLEASAMWIWNFPDIYDSFVGMNIAGSAESLHDGN